MSEVRVRSGAVTRERILDAAAHVLDTLGLAHATTREIARAAGYSEATLYKHFRDKEELYLGVLRERRPPFIDLLVQLPPTAGSGSVGVRLEELVAQALAFYRRNLPLSGALFSSPELLASHRSGLLASGAGPHRAVELLAEYLRAEAGLGRVSRQVEPGAGAALLLGACFQRAFLDTYMGAAVSDDADTRFGRDLVEALLRGLAPDRMTD